MTVKELIDLLQDLPADQDVQRLPCTTRDWVGLSELRAQQRQVERSARPEAH